MKYGRTAIISNAVKTRVLDLNATEKIIFQNVVCHKSCQAYRDATLNENLHQV